MPEASLKLDHLNMPARDPEGLARWYEQTFGLKADGGFMWLATQPLQQPNLSPGWLLKALAASDISGAEAQALLERAPLDIRANRLKIDREALRESLPQPAEPLAAPDGLRLPAGTAVEQWPQFAQGLFEVQDGGSQIACAALGVRPGEAVVDLCAGAGGKSLALAAALDNRGTLLACDTDRTRLSRLGPRAHRAGAAVETRLLDPGKELEALADWQGRADAVLVDAPCSGSGTWRRNPEARWRLDEAGLARLVALQRHVLEVAAPLVRPGGRLIYVTCSLLDEEGARQVDSFLAAHPGWHAAAPELPLGRPRGAGLRLTPFHDGTDGFFIARLEKP